jgi:bifunctional non-homologous end joining protein LigD
LRELGRALGSREVILDGEIVTLDDRGKPSFELLQRRMHLGSEAAVRRLAKSLPVVYMVFDVLYLDGHSTMQLTYGDRRGLLAQLELSGSHWKVPAHHEGDGAALLEASREQELEGIVAKRLNSQYEPGKRSGAWRKIKNTLRQEFVIGGWLPGQGGRSGRIGSLAVGYHDTPPKAAPEEAERRRSPQKLIYAGQVGTGFKEPDLVQLSGLLEALRRDSSPFQGRQPPKETVFVEPRLVCEVEFREWTRSRTLRAPSFKGLRDDKDPSEVVWEVAEPVDSG